MDVGNICLQPLNLVVLGETTRFFLWTFGFSIALAGLMRQVQFVRTIEFIFMNGKKQSKSVDFFCDGNGVRKLKLKLLWI